MRVLHVETGRHIYGGGRQVLYLLQGLEQEALVENLLVCCRNSEFAAEAASRGITTLELPMHGDLDLLLPMRLMLAIRRFDPDLVHVHSRRGAESWGGLAARLAGVKAVITRRVDNPENPVVARAKYRLFARVITISQGIADVLLSHGVPGQKLVCVHSAVHAERFMTECDQGWFKDQFALSPDAQSVGMIAQLIPRKGHQVLLKAISEILDRCPRARFLLFGRGPLLESLQTSVHEMGLDGVVIFAGFRHDLPHILPCLSLLVHPASMEGLGVSLLQAAAACLPIVSTPVGGIPEIVRHGHNGILVPVQDHHALAEAVTELLQDPQKSLSFGRNGREHVRREFSVQSMVRGNLAVYRDVLRGSV